jgi:hypothetical protein
MPSVSDRQNRAMQAAAAGHSTIGIPKKVAREFVKADRAKARGKRKMRRGGRKA